MLSLFVHYCNTTVNKGLKLLKSLLMFIIQQKPINIISLFQTLKVILASFLSHLKRPVGVMELLQPTNHRGVNFQVAYKIFSCLTTLFSSYFVPRTGMSSRDSSHPVETGVYRSLAPTRFLWYKLSHGSKEYMIALIRPIFSADIRQITAALF